MTHLIMSGPPARLPALLAALLAVSATGACASSQRVEPFAYAVRSYNEAVRWQRYDDAAARLPVHRRDEFLDQRDVLSEDLRVTEYDVVRVRYDDSGRRAKVQLEYTWYMDSLGVVHNTHVVQRWERPKKTWVLVDEHHLRGEPMPGIDPAPAAGDRSRTRPDEPPDDRFETGAGPETSDAPVRNVRKRTGSAAHSRRNPSI